MIQNQIFKRSRVFVNLVNEIRSKGIDIPEDNIEGIIELYIRVILSSGEDGFDNYITPFCVQFDPFATIDFDNIDEDGIQSINRLVIEICGILEGLNKKDPENHPTVIDKDLVATITSNHNIAIIFNEIQKMMHFIGAMAQDDLINHKYSFADDMCSYWQFCSFNEKMRVFSIVATQLMNSKHIFVVETNFTFIPSNYLHQNNEN